MKKIVLVIVSIVLAMGVIFIMTLLGSIVGAFAGWLVGLLFGETILGILESLGISGFAMWQIGAFLGFISGFFKKFNTKKEG
jgi:hypothetical protein